MQDTELRQVPTVGSVVEMRLVRALLLAIVATVALVGGVASTAYADTAPSAPVQADVPSGDGSANGDPSDPGLPPD